MSYTQADARFEFEMLCDEALQQRDIAKAMLIRDMYAKEGNGVEADYWDLMARRWNDEDWAFDRERDNDL